MEIVTHQDGEFNLMLDAICNYLQNGYIWHKKAANQCRKIYIRGWGRWHDEEAKCDSNTLLCLEKVLWDKLKFSPTYDVARFEKASVITINNLEDFKNHHLAWKQREDAFISTLNKAMEKARGIDIEVYKKLMCILEEVQCERMRLDMAYDRLTFAGWNTHDIGVCSMIIHKYFECEHKDGHDINFNIG